MTLRVTFLLAVLLTAVLLTGCGGQETPVERAEDEAGLEEVVEEETAEEVATSTDIDCADVKPENMQKLVADATPDELEQIRQCNMAPEKVAEREREQQKVAEKAEIADTMNLLDCQLNKMAAKEGKDKAEAFLEQSLTDAFESGFNGEEPETDMTLQEDLAERGYECTEEEVREMLAEQQKEQRKAVDEMAQKQAEAQQESGVNAAGQDVSNIPMMTPEESRAYAQCLQQHMAEIDSEKRGKEEQRITREANERGVARSEIIGC